MPGLFASHHRLTNCCLCLSLKTGCKIIASLTTFICSLELISACHKLIELLEKERICRDEISYEAGERAYFNTCPNIKVVQFLLITDLIIFVIGFNGSILLLYGIKSKQPRLFYAWYAFLGMVIFSNFFSILIWHNMAIMMNIIIVVILAYFFRVVRSYHLLLLDELNSGCPLVGVAFPQESSMRVLMPTQRTTSTTSDYIKDDPPPPYPGLPVVASSLSIDSQPPPYSVVNPNYEGPPVPNVSSPSNALTSDTGFVDASVPSRCNESETNISRNTLGQSTAPLVNRDTPEVRSLELPSLASCTSQNIDSVNRLTSPPDVDHLQTNSDELSQHPITARQSLSHSECGSTARDLHDVTLSPANQSASVSTDSDQSSGVEEANMHHQEAQSPSEVTESLDKSSNKADIS